MDIKTITNPVFKKNVVDNENGVIVKSIYLKKKTRMDRDMKTLVWQFYRHRNSLNVNDVIKKYGRDSLIINYSIKPKSDDKDSKTACCMKNACMNDAFTDDCDYSMNDYSMNDYSMNDYSMNDYSMNGIGMNGIGMNGIGIGCGIAKGTFGAQGTFGSRSIGGSGMNGCSFIGDSTIDYIDHGIMDELQTEIETIINNNYDPYTLSGPHFQCEMRDLVDHTRMI
jgi:hypothetical protein